MKNVNVEELKKTIDGMSSLCAKGKEDVRKLVGQIVGEDLTPALIGKEGEIYFTPDGGEHLMDIRILVKDATNRNCYQVKDIRGHIQSKSPEN